MNERSNERMNGRSQGAGANSKEGSDEAPYREADEELGLEGDKTLGSARNAVTFGALLALLVLVAVFCVSVRNGSHRDADASAADGEFVQVDETVTAKDLTNLHAEPAMVHPNIVEQLRNGETLTRTGINEETGWSRLVWEGQTVYAVSEYLTTDLDYRPSVGPGSRNFFLTADHNAVVFQDCDDTVTPKEYVNLRSEPSTSQGDTTVRAHLEAGEQVHRTGYSEDAGWSRVEYDGKVLYVVSSYMETVQEETR